MVWHSRARLTVAVVAALIVVPPELTILSGVIAALRDPVTPEEYVLARASALPQTTVELKSIPLSLRKAIFRALPPAERSRLWRAHFSEYVQTHEALDADQLAVLADAHALMSPTNLANADSPELRAAANEITVRARVAFPTQDTNELFYWFGPIRPVPLTASAALRSPSKLHMFAYLFVLNARMPPACSCNQEWDCGIAGPTCDLAGGACTVDSSWPACGPFWMQDCDGSSC